MSSLDFRTVPKCSSLFSANGQWTRSPDRADNVEIKALISDVSPISKELGDLRANRIFIQQIMDMPSENERVAAEGSLGETEDK
ncbi:Hypothetical protein NTJ_09688 [Nesidiocoris tenuis]|uniref:Uncharacterized protein n=1 Tax=Nesidiocoris tenuis TaxID=355587 RepID=A0ABN7AXG6_9HEMI|nr:Hypothetical protein NTJ_09688 [Nesidiocoris tenuis]